MVQHSAIDHTGLTGVGSADAIDDTLIDAKGDLIAGSAADTPAKLTVGANDTILMADSAQTTGLKWVASQTPSTQAFGDSAAEGTADTYARGDHKHAMPTPNMVRILDVVLGSDTASFDFTSIPGAGTYTSLVLDYQIRSDRASNTADAFRMRFNADSSSIYDYSARQHDGAADFFTQAAAANGFNLVAECSAATAAAGNAGAGRIIIPNHAGTTWHKQYLCDGVCVLGTTAGQIRSWETKGSWRSTAAITRITLTPVNGSNFKTGSRATLYGIS